MTETRVLHYQTAQGRCPFQEWVESVKDKAAKAAVAARINRVRAGTLGDWKAVGVVILLSGGEKRSQDANIKRAKEYWRDYENRTKSSTGRRPA